MKNQNCPNCEKEYMRGQRAAYQAFLLYALKHLGYTNHEYEPLVSLGRLIGERESAIHTLRIACDELGDDDWEPTLHLSDIIEKHLARHCNQEAE